MYLPPYPPFVSLFPLSKLPYTLCIVVWVLPRVMMWIVGMIPFSPDRRQQYCRRGAFGDSILLCLISSRWRWHHRDGGTAIGVSCTTRLIVACWILTLINCASIVNTRRSTMHDKRWWAVYYYCCVVIVVGGGGGIIISICLHLLERWRDRNIRDVISTTSKNKQYTHNPNATTTAMALSHY